MQVGWVDAAPAATQDASRREAAAAVDNPWQRSAQVTWVQGDALDLPFDDSSFDAATMGYGLRNVADIPRALRELRRVLVPGGTVAVLDFNNSSQPLVDNLQVSNHLPMTAPLYHWILLRALL